MWAATLALVSLIAALDFRGRQHGLAGRPLCDPDDAGAVVLRPAETAAASCPYRSLLRACFDTPSSHAELILRFLFAVLAYFGSSLFVTALVRNRALVIEHLDRVEREQAPPAREKLKSN